MSEMFVFDDCVKRINITGFKKGSVIIGFQIENDNKLIGVIFAGYRMIENVGLSSPLVAIKVFLKKSIAKGEMLLWETNNKPEVNTQVDRLWIQNMKAKLNDVFGK